MNEAERILLQGINDKLERMLKILEALYVLTPQYRTIQTMKEFYPTTGHWPKGEPGKPK